MQARIATGIAVAGLIVIALAFVAAAPWADDSSAGGRLQGDADCSGDVDTADALSALRFAASVPPFAGCVQEAGDVDCDGDVDPDDVLLLLLFSGGVPPNQPASAGCTDIGDPLGPPGSPSPTVSGGASPTGTPIPGSQTPTATPAGTPIANGYHLETVLSPTNLGAANLSVVELALIPGSPDEAIVVQQSGPMYRVSLSGAFAPELWGNITQLLESPGTRHNEEGLLSLAFSPDFAQDGRVYLYYTTDDPDDRSVLERFNATNTDLDGGSAHELLSIPQFMGNHNGGHVAFDHDGYLLLSLGDGGGGGDPEDNGQDLDSLLGKVLRIDVSPTSGYAIPGGNPFANAPGLDEIFAYGFRNPWRMTVDSLTGDIWLGDVGQGEWEEVDHVTAGGNYGWDCYEGFEEFEFPGDPDQCTGKQFTQPRAVYGHGFGLAVTGGFVYRGSAMPELYGWYVYGDFYSGRIWGVNTAGNSDPVQLTKESVNVASFTELPNGELLIVSYSDGIFQLARD